MSEPKQLCHEWCETDDSFFKKVDECGGWPLNKKYVMYHHSEDRRCEFADEYVRNGWWTTLYSTDDYYKWKLSKKAIDEIKLEARREIIRELGGISCV